MSAFFVVEVEGTGYKHHWPTFELALADFLRLFNEGKSEDIALRYSS